MNTVNFILAAVILLALTAPGRALQTPGGRESSRANEPNQPPPKPKKPGRPAAEGKDRKLKPSTATLSISVTPGDSTINLQGVEYRAENGVFIRNGLSPGKYRIVIHKDKYQNEAYEISLGPGDQRPLNVSLKLLNGNLTVAPLLADTEINITELTTGKSVGIYSGRAHHVELRPGRYQVFISKEGFKTMVREVSIEPLGNVSLEPSLAPLPKPAAAVRRAEPPFQRDYEMQARTNFEGKFIVVVLTGRSSDTVNELGAIDITLRVGGGQAQVTNISGMLTGYPCRVDFVRLENVAEYSFVEPPGAANQWARAVVRLRPKDSKRAVHFLINWKSLRSTVPNEPPTN
jgi:hypothetical protein